MANWSDMNTEEKLEWLRHEDQSTRQVVAQLSAHLAEVAGAVAKLEKQVAKLEGGK
jgi:hypothetical protein